MSKPKFYQGKSTRPGGGGSFAMMEDALEARGFSKKSAGAIAADAGRKKYGKKKFASMAAAGKRRAEREKK